MLLLKNNSPILHFYLLSQQTAILLIGWQDFILTCGNFSKVQFGFCRPYFYYLPRLRALVQKPSCMESTETMRQQDNLSFPVQLVGLFNQSSQSDKVHRIRRIEPRHFVGIEKSSVQTANMKKRKRATFILRQIYLWKQPLDPKGAIGGKTTQRGQKCSITNRSLS